MDLYTSSDEEDEHTPCPTNAFDVLMQPPPKKAKKTDHVDPVMIAVVYIRWLKWIDPSAPLFGCPYVGQAVRAGNSKEGVVAARWGQEDSDANRLNKRVGLMHELKVHGSVAFRNEIVEWREGPRSEVQKWANEREIALIAEHGGPLCDPSVRCKQTLNLTNGGKGNVNFEARDASRTVAWLHFQDEMQEYVECYKTSFVQRTYVNPVSGYRLGQQLASVRQGRLWRGHPDEAKRVKWLQSLPGWAWNATETSEYKKGKSELKRSQWANADKETRAEWIRKNSESHSTPEAKASQSERAKKQFESQEARDVLSERAKAQWANADEETRAEWTRKNSESHSTPEAKEAASKRGKAQFEREEDANHGYRSRRAKAQMSTPEAVDRQSLQAKQWWETATQEQIDCMESNRKKAIASSRERRMEGMTESQRKSEIAKQESNKRKDARKKRLLLALRQVPGWEKAHNRDIPKARLAGVLPSID